MARLIITSPIQSNINTITIDNYAKSKVVLLVVNYRY